MQVAPTSPITISAMTLRREPGQVLDRVFYRNERFIVERAGEPKAVIVPLREYQEMQRLKGEARERFWTMTQELRQAFANEDPQTVEREVEQAIDEVRHTPSPTS